ncbi:MAG: transporter substrate-binding domain-containing protein [Actinomycetota bacterium]|nr:MAG: transporter substrate-binding domain-containing protein [Actinomycetota bacterium]
MKIREFKWVAVLVAAMGMTAAACGSSSNASGGTTTAASGSSGGATTTQGSLESASISVIPSSDEFAPLYEMLNTGAFKSQGVDMKLVNVESGSALVTSLEAGTADFTQAPISVLAGALANGAPITIFAPAQPVAGFELESKSGSKFTTIQSLKGQKIGVSKAGSLTAQYAASTIQKYNLGATIVPVGANGQVSALESGEVAAVVEASPACYTLVSSGKAQVLENYATAVPTLQAWAASTSFLKSHEALTTKVLKAWYGALKAYDTDSTQGETPFLTTFKEPADVASQQYKFIVQNAPTSATLSVSDIQAAYSLLAASGGNTSKLPPAQSLANSQFTSLVG